ncbi:hypothetical protein ACQP2X_30245 [Actinoplanes sp. CA-131856]
MAGEPECGTPLPSNESRETSRPSFTGHVTVRCRELALSQGQSATWLMKRSAFSSRRCRFPVKPLINEG